MYYQGCKYDTCSNHLIVIFLFILFIYFVNCLNQEGNVLPVCVLIKLNCTGQFNQRSTVVDVQRFNECSYDA